MKKWLGVLLLAFLGACSFLTSDTSTVEQGYASAYLGDIQSLYDTQQKMMDAYQKQFGDVDDVGKESEYLQNTLIPDYTAFVVRAKKIDTPTEEIKNLHTQYIEAIEKQLDVYKEYEAAFKHYETSIDIATLTAANNNAKRANMLFDSFDEELMSFFAKHKIVVVNN